MKIYTVWLTVVANGYRLARHVERHDKDLARQMRRACSSAALNVAEAMHGRAGNRIARFHDSMGSARETRACLQVCVAATYVVQAAIDADLDRIDYLVASLYRLCQRRRA